MKNAVIFFLIMAVISTQETTHEKIAADIVAGETNILKEIAKLVNQVKTLKKTIEIQQKKIKDLERVSKLQKYTHLLKDLEELAPSVEKIKKGDFLPSLKKRIEALEKQQIFNFDDDMSFQEIVKYKSNQSGIVKFQYSGSGILLFVMASGGGLHKENRLRIFVDGEEWRNYYKTTDNTKSNFHQTWSWYDDSADNNCGWIAVMPMITFENEILIELYNGSTRNESCFRLNFLSSEPKKEKNK